jgi:hypothetical protein
MAAFPVVDVYGYLGRLMARAAPVEIRAALSAT